MQKPPPMHLNTSPTSFEGYGTGKHEQIHKTLKNSKLAPKKKLGKPIFTTGVPTPLNRLFAYQQPIGPDRTILPLIHTSDPTRPERMR